MNPFKNVKAPPAKVGTSNGYMPKPPKIRKPNIKTPSADSILKNGTLGDNQNFNK